MAPETSDPKNSGHQIDLRSLKVLKPRQLLMIDEALRKVGDFGEVRLVIQNGRLRFIRTLNSYDAQKWPPDDSEELASG